MMNSKKLEATYLVDEAYLLHLQETSTAFEYHCFTKNGAEVGIGQIDRDDIEKSEIRSPLACICALAIQDIGLDGKKSRRSFRRNALAVSEGQKAP